MKALKSAPLPQASAAPVSASAEPLPASANAPASAPVLLKSVPAQIVPPSPRPQLAQPAFREVLEETAGLQEAPSAVAVPEGKTVALSLRVSDVEQARIQAGAARANLSVSAYLRQCALGVEELRGQVQLALGELQKGEPRTPPLPGMKAIPGILTRFAASCFQRLRGRHQEYTGITLR